MRTEDSSWKESNPLNVSNLNRGVMIDQFGCVVIEVPYNSRQPIEKQFASIFFEPKVKNPEIQAPKIRKDSLTDAEKRIKELENTPVKRIKIVIKYLRPKLKDLKTAVLPAPSTNVRKSLFNLRIISSLLRDLPKPPPPPPRSRFSSANSSYSQIGFYMRSSHPEPPPIKRRPSVVTKTSSIYLQE